MIFAAWFMNIIEFIGMGAKKYGGFERYVLEEAIQLKAKGHRLIVVFDREPIAKEYISDLKRTGALIHIIPYTNKVRFLCKVNSLLSKYKPDVVHTNFSSSILWVQLLACLRRVPIRIATEHCLPVLSNLKLKFVYSFLALCVHHILPVSKQSALSMKQGIWWKKDIIQTLYLGVNDFSYNKREMRGKYQLPQDKMLLMNVAYHNPVKGVDILLKAFSLFVKQYGVKDMVLCQIGGGQTGKDTEYLKGLARSLGIGDFVIWMGIQNNVPEILSAGDIYCQPSRSEGLGLSIVEASLAKLPVIATRVGGIPEIAIDGCNAILVEAEDYKSMAEAIYLLYKNPDRRKKMGEMGRQESEDRFVLKTQVNKLIKEYYKI